MKKNSQLLFYILLTTVFLNSCTVKKRLYGSGYYIQSHGAKKKQTDSFTNKSKPVDSQSAPNSGQKIEEEPIIASINNETIQLPKTNNESLFIESNQPIKKKKITSFSTFKNEIKNTIETIPSPKNERQLLPLSLGAFLLSLFGLFRFGIIVGICAISFGIVSIILIKKRPEKRKGIGWAIAAIVLGLLDIIGAVLFIALFLL